MQAKYVFILLIIFLVIYLIIEFVRDRRREKRSIIEAMGKEVWQEIDRERNSRVRAGKLFRRVLEQKRKDLNNTGAR